MLSLADIATQLQVSKTFALALPRFYKKTGLNAQINFLYNQKEENIEISLGFLPREPNEQEYNLLVEILFESESLLTNEYVINSCKGFETIEQLVFKHKEDTNQIVSKHKEDL